MSEAAITSVGFGNANIKNANLAFDLGIGNSEIYNKTGANITVDMGALSGGPGTKLSGQTGNFTTTYSIGNRGDSTTFAGTIRDGSGSPATTALIKVGAGTLTLSGTSTFTGSLSISSGTVAVTGAGSLTTTAISLATSPTAARVATIKLDNHSRRITAMIDD